MEARYGSVFALADFCHRLLTVHVKLSMQALGNTRMKVGGLVQDALDKAAAGCLSFFFLCNVALIENL